MGIRKTRVDGLLGWLQTFCLIFFFVGVGLCHLRLWISGLAICFICFFLYVILYEQITYLDAKDAKDRAREVTGQSAKPHWLSVFRSRLSVVQSWLAILAFVLFGGVALGVGFLFVLGLFAGPGTVGGEFVSLHSAVIVVVCGSIAFTIRRKKGPRR